MCIYKWLKNNLLSKFNIDRCLIYSEPYEARPHMLSRQATLVESHDQFNITHTSIPTYNTLIHNLCLCMRTKYSMYIQSLTNLFSLCFVFQVICQNFVYNSLHAAKNVRKKIRENDEIMRVTKACIREAIETVEASQVKKMKQILRKHFSLIFFHTCE